MAEIPVIFTTSLAVRGFNNGVVNLALQQAQFLPENVDGKVQVTAQEVIVANLRMDLFCAQQVYEAIGKILEDQTKPMPPSKSEVN
jgi:hypothetical protein